jgi:hypothetical protein
MSILPTPHLLAAMTGGGGASSIFGSVDNPLNKYGNVADSNGGIILFLTNILRFVFIIAGIYALINFILAGFQYMSAAGDSKALTAAWARIWQTLLGLVIIVASFAIAALVGVIFFGNAGFILNPVIYGP